MSSKRVAMSKSLRFEVFKRDSFTCQYCGKKAPDCVLHVDHIHPVAKGGGNEILNLVTSCMACNSGKGARLLGDATAIAKQQAQLEELQERRDQLDMLMQWKTGLLDIVDSTASKLADYFAKMTGWGLTPASVERLKHTLRRFSVAEVTAAMEQSISRYVQLGADGHATRESASKANEYIEKIAKVTRTTVDNPDLAVAYHVRNIARKRCPYSFNDRDAMSLIDEAREAGATPDQMRSTAARCRNWTTFCQLFGDLIESLHEKAAAR